MAELTPPGTLKPQGPDIGPAARLISIAIGIGLGAMAARQRGAGRAALGVAAAGLAARGVSGRSALRSVAAPGPDEQQLADAQGWNSAAIVGRSVTINARPRVLYDLWRDFRNLPKFMLNIDAIEVIDDQRSRWTVAAPGGATVEWEAEITDDQPGRRIAWQSAPGAAVRNSGSVEFRDAPSGRGTEVHAVIAYEPPVGIPGRIIAKLTQREPGIQARRDLKRLKAIVETGEIATNAPQGRRPKA
jgi:uncharacterized membrane protein